jgi:uncharacterized protein YxjI
LAFTTDWVLSNEKYVLSNSYSIYPNPAQQQFTIEGNQLEDVKVEITDILGRQIHAIQQSKVNKIEVNTADMSPGLYQVKMSKGNAYEIQSILIQP